MRISDNFIKDCADELANLFNKSFDIDYERDIEYSILAGNPNDNYYLKFLRSGYTKSGIPFSTWLCFDCNNNIIQSGWKIH